MFTFCTSGYLPLLAVQRLLDQMSFSWNTFTNRLTALSYIHRMLEFCRAWPFTSVISEWRQETSVFMGKRRTWVYVQIALGTMALIMQLVSVIQVLQFSSNIISTEMSFGQIVAVGIWVPVLLEYGYLEISGAAKGTEYRLKFPLVVAEKMPHQSAIMTPEMISGRGLHSSEGDEQQCHYSSSLH
ncbi:hypothetical protein DL98DRAFT_240983 [Cadophora sp. DSE1049]|nr:hypothetical protein DL98DRAFT_240983 [Cadophora sp. DSE1049]